MVYEAVFFDWNGVITKDPADGFLERLLADCGADSEQIQEIMANYIRQLMRGEITEKDYWDALKHDYNLTIPDSISDRFLEWKGLEADTDMLLFVEKLNKNNIKTAVLSNVIIPSYNVIKQAGYYNRFDEVIASCIVGFDKPDPEIYQLALETLGVRPENSIFIDDKQSCLDPAEAMGFTIILAENSKQIIGEVSKLIPLVI